MHGVVKIKAARMIASGEWPRSWWLVIAAICLLGIAAFRAMVAIRPSLGDAALFMYFGRRMNEGATLYVDIWDLKPPLIYLVNAAADQLGAPFAGIALFETGALSAGLGLLWTMLRRAGAWPPAIALAMLSFSVLVSYDAIAEGANYTEIYVIPFAALSMALFTRGLVVSSPACFAGAGAAAALAACSKLPGMAPMLAQAGFLLVMLLVPGRRKAVAFALGSVLIGFAACLAAVGGLIASMTDLNAALDGSILHPINYAKRPVPGSGHELGDQIYILPALAVPLLLALAAAAIGAAGLVASVRTPTPSGRAHLLLPGRELAQYGGLFALWALADLAGALGTGRNYGHYFLPFALSSAASAAVLITAVRSALPRWPSSLLLTLFAGSLCMNALNAARMGWWRVSARAAGLEAAIPPSQQDALREIRARAEPGDTLAVWENMHALYLAGRVRNALPHLALINGADSDYALRTKAPGILQGLERCPPTFLVLVADTGLSDVSAKSYEASIRRLAASRFDLAGGRPNAFGTEMWVRRGPTAVGCRSI